MWQAAARIRLLHRLALSAQAGCGHRREGQAHLRTEEEEPGAYHAAATRSLQPSHPHALRHTHLPARTQELEKFKFVLDYKIKELKQQIEPRENEITAMRKQIRDVDAELEAYHKSNAELDELVGRLRSQLDALQVRARDAGTRSRCSKTSPRSRARRRKRASCGAHCCARRPA